MAAVRTHAIEALRSDASPDAMGAVVDLVRTATLGIEQIAALATVLGQSGDVLSHTAADRTADLASTGGPTSLSTLIGPLCLRTFGYRVPKLGVIGRPAGGVDVLAQIPGYRVRLSSADVRSVLDVCGYAHFLAGDDHAPLDARFFRYRQENAAQSIPDLAIASLLAKKIAVGVRHVILDVRVGPHGNFGHTMNEARHNAKRFARVAGVLGLSSACFVTDARYPYQRYIGRSESLLALYELLYEASDRALTEHAASCYQMALPDGRAYTADSGFNPRAAKRVFLSNLYAQGATEDAFLERVADVGPDHRFNLLAQHSGHFVVDLGGVRTLIGRFQRLNRSGHTEFPDGMGIILRKTPGDSVVVGDVLATVRITEAAWASVRPDLQKMFRPSDGRPERVPHERVENG